MSTRTDAKQSGRKWFPLTKGGAVRKWYGNNEYVVNWEDDGREMLGYAAKLYGSPTRTVKNMDFYFREGITWSTISNRFSMRFSAAGAISETKGAMCFADSKDDLIYLLGFSNSCLVESFLKVFSPTLDFHEGPFGKLPFIKSRESDTIKSLSNECVSLARADWDNFETSWDFRDQPLLRPGLKGATLEASWRNWEAHCTAAIRQMQELETENNRLFIAAYGLEGELSPEVPEEQITLARADQRKDVAAFLSYAVGCMMGRYSLDAEGLICADAGDTVADYLRIVNEKWGELPEDEDSGITWDEIAFPPDEDAIIPVLEGEWFVDDIVARTRDFLRVTFGEATLKENLRFIEDSLGKSLEKYFLTDFYKDHLQTYKKRPIYWLFQSPKRGFSALVYLHRYTKDTVNTLLNRYLRDYLKKLESRIAHLTQVEATANTTKEKTAARKEREKLEKALKDCQDWERDVILPLAQQRLEIDLDDGVKVNYLKFEGGVAKIPGLAAKED
jgi:type II restriction/modification system DNA methylase subunit YeeA